MFKALCSDREVNVVSKSPNHIFNIDFDVYCTSGVLFRPSCGSVAGYGSGEEGKHGQSREEDRDLYLRAGETSGSL